VATQENAKQLAHGCGDAHDDATGPKLSPSGVGPSTGSKHQVEQVTNNADQKADRSLFAAARGLMTRQLSFPGTDFFRGRAIDLEL
jgi:hypothetical protein